MMSSQKKKVTLYFNAAMLAETQKEALRQDRSISWIIQAAWRMAREEVKRIPPGAAAAGHGLTAMDSQGSSSQISAAVSGRNPATAFKV